MMTIENAAMPPAMSMVSCSPSARCGEGSDEGSMKKPGMMRSLLRLGPRLDADLAAGLVMALVCGGGFAVQLGVTPMAYQDAARFNRAVDQDAMRMPLDVPPLRLIEKEER